ncbi:MAG: hypothetical protein Q9M28_00790 [Mariprofundaceae bacterium]|nr:hypothetical protein [Mariprofundaceae bacterium]
MRSISKFTWVMLILAVVSLAMIGCRQNPQGGGATTGGTTISGFVQKGPFIKGTTVLAFMLDAYANRIGAGIPTTTTDDLGSYSVHLPNTVGNDLIEIEVTGTYLDENTGLPSTGTGTGIGLLPVIVAPTGKLNVNDGSSIVTTVFKAQTNNKLLMLQGGKFTAQTKFNLQNANKQVGTALGMSATMNSAAGLVPLDFSQLNVLAPADPTLGTANTQLLAVSAMILDAALNSNAATVDTFITALAQDIYTGVKLGTTLDTQQTSAPGTTTTIIIQSQQKVAQATNVTKVINNINTFITNNAANNPTAPTVTSVTVVNVANVTTTFNPVITQINNQSNTILRGFGIANNSFDVGSAATGFVTYNVAADGVATAGNGTITANNVKVNLTFKDYSNAGGTGATGAKATYVTTLGFAIAASAANDSRAMTGYIYPLNITADGNGGVTAVIPTTAQLNFSGTTATGVVVTGTVPNLAINTISNNTAGAVVVDMNQILKSIQNSANQPSLNVLATTGSFKFSFGLGGLNIGSEKATTGTGLASFFPTNPIVGGRNVSGTIVTN